MEGKTIGGINGHIRISSNQTPLQHAFCMYAAMESTAENIFKASDLGFGDSWICFNDGDEFLRRVQESVTRLGHSYQTGLVEYVDELGYSGDIGPFRKRKKYQNESEARIIIGPGGTKPLVLDIGSIRDLVGQVHDILDISKRLKIDRPSQ